MSGVDNMLFKYPDLTKSFTHPPPTDEPYVGNADSYAFIEEVDPDNLSVMSDEDAAWDLLDEDSDNSSEPPPKKRCRFEPSNSPLPFGIVAEVQPTGKDAFPALSRSLLESSSDEATIALPIYPSGTSRASIDRSLFAINPSHWPSKRKRKSSSVTKVAVELLPVQECLEKLSIRTRRRGLYGKRVRMVKPLPNRSPVTSSAYSNVSGDSSRSGTPSLTRSSSISSCNEPAGDAAQSPQFIVLQGAAAQLSVYCKGLEDDSLS